MTQLSQAQKKQLKAIMKEFKRLKLGCRRRKMQDGEIRFNEELGDGV